ncbi:MAG: PilN domain-containing protein [Deltaproteobacteria bacterium]
MIRINLMPREEARRAATKQRDQRIAIAVFGLLLLIVVMAEFVTRNAAGTVEAQAAAYREDLIELDRKHRESMQLERRRRELRAKLDTIEVLERQRKGPVYVLGDLSAATPDALWLTEIRETGGSAFLKGRGLDNQTIALFMRQLEASPYFEAVDLVETTHVEEGNAELKEFSIRARVLYAGREIAADGKGAP